MKEKYADEISDALGRAADAIEDIDDPRHYSKEDLKEIARKAKLWRQIAAMPRPKVEITATDDTVKIVVRQGGKVERLEYSFPGILTGADVAQLLDLCGIQTDYQYTH